MPSTSFHFQDGTSLVGALIRVALKGSFNLKRLQPGGIYSECFGVLLVTRVYNQRGEVGWGASRGCFVSER